MNVLMGAWLFISAFLWRHTTAQLANALTVGVLLVACALLAERIPNVRYASTALALWLFVSPLVLPTERIAKAGALTTSTSMFIAVVVFIFSLRGMEDVEDGGPSAARRASAFHGCPRVHRRKEPRSPPAIHRRYAG